jgi:hypothetical protein
VLVVTKKGKPFGIVTKGYIVKGISNGISFKKVLLEEFATRPGLHIIKSNCRRCSKSHDAKQDTKTTCTTTGKTGRNCNCYRPCNVFVPTRRLGLTESIFHVITRANARKK